MLSRGEFGILGMERILALLGEHGVSGSFFIPGHTIETFPEICRRTHAAGHEIAHHGWTHRRPDDIYNAGGVEAEREELVRGIEAIKSITGAPPTGYRSPAWDLSPATLELLIELGRCNAGAMKRRTTACVNCCVLRTPIQSGWFQCLHNLPHRRFGSWHAGFSYDSSLMATDYTPYWARTDPVPDQVRKRSLFPLFILR
jgi:peptidoglycan/xylan/chitin deacetylase (PgdA/CDA1 family)